MRVELASPATQEAALAYLSASPYANVFLCHVLLHGMARTAHGDAVVALNGDEVTGAAYFGRQLVIAGDEPALEALAAYAKRRGGARMIVGERDAVRYFWKALSAWHAPPRVVRDRQYVMMVDRSRLQPVPAGTIVRHALPAEWRAVAEGSAELILQELGYDPRRGSPDFGANVRQTIARELCWVGLAGDRICFICSIGPWSDRTIQLQGVWTPPPMRGRGLATAAFTAICDRLLEVSPTLSLYVNDFNEKAVALYLRSGFERVADFQTLLF